MFLWVTVKNQTRKNRIGNNQHSATITIALQNRSKTNHRSRFTNTHLVYTVDRPFPVQIVGPGDISKVSNS